MLFFNLFSQWRKGFAAVALMAASMLAQAALEPYTVTAPDGVRIAVQEAGDPNGQPIIFIHGLLGEIRSQTAISPMPAKNCSLTPWCISPTVPCERFRRLRSKPAACPSQ